MFDERTFVTQKQKQWHDLSIVLERVNLQGLRSLPPSDLTRLGSLYRRTVADLAFSRTQRATPELVFYLNELVGHGHGVLYQAAASRSLWQSLRDFFSWELPTTLRRNTPFIATAFALTVLGTLLAYGIVRHNPANLSLFVPPGMQDSFNGWKEGFADNGTISAGEGAEFSAMLMTHNTSVGFIAFALGITTILPAYLMLENGLIMGALIAVVQPTGYLTSLWAGILPHGVCELSAIFIAGGAGLLTGWALIHPGQLSRKEALLSNGKESVKMVLGTIPLFIIAGIIEGNVSHASLPHYFKFTLAGVQFAALLFYIYGGWVHKPAH